MKALVTALPTCWSPPSELPVIGMYPLGKGFAMVTAGFGVIELSVTGETVSLANPNGSPNFQGEGDVLVYSATGLSAGSHLLKFLEEIAATERKAIIDSAALHWKLWSGFFTALRNNATASAAARREVRLQA